MTVFLRTICLVVAAICLIVPTARGQPTFTNVSVHDPDVIRVDGTFYVFGSHMAVAESPDLVAWKLVAAGVRDDNPIIPNVTTEMAAALAWGQSDTFWAGCVTRLDDGRFAFYYSVCKGDSPRAALGLALSDKVAGPYRDAGILLRSGMWDQPSEDGVVYDATVHPNAVDPAAFRDAAGGMWMVYGSYSGGVFVLKLDATTGRPLPGQGYGKKLLGGNHGRIEAPYVLYDPDSGYFHLFLSFGGLGSDGGYQVRVARSRSPDGPYLDPAGRDMIDAKGPAGSFFDDAAIDPFGGKLMGNFEFAADGDAPAWGFVSPGHNSAYRDPDTGASFIVFHTRLPGRGEEHEVRVHPLLFNADGWPVVAPLRYDGTPQPAGPYDAANVAGEYALVRHDRGISADIARSQLVRLTSGGAVEGGSAGSWRMTGDQTLAITLDGTKYDGVFLTQWDAARQTRVLTFTALSTDGTSVWGVGTAPATPVANAK